MGDIRYRGWSQGPLCRSLLQSKGANAILKGKNKNLREELRIVKEELAEVRGCPSAPALQALRAAVDLYENRVAYLLKRIDVLAQDNERLERVAVKQHWEIKALKEKLSREDAV